MLFFNDEGDEVGGLTYTGREANGTRRADAGLMFGQLKQDQTIGISYSEGNGRRTAGLTVWDRSDTRLGDLIEKLNAANRMTDRVERDAAAWAAPRSSEFRFQERPHTGGRIPPSGRRPTGSPPAPSSRRSSSR